MIGRPTRHGMTNTPIWVSWKCMVDRATRHGKDSARYAGRGITIPAEWEKFENFFKDMGEGFSKGLTLDRIDNDKSYSKENCRWATRKEQADNRSNRVLVPYKGRIIGLEALSEECGVPKGTLWQRLRSYGWSVERATTTPLMTRAEAGKLGAVSIKRKN